MPPEVSRPPIVTFDIDVLVRQLHFSRPANQISPVRFAATFGYTYENLGNLVQIDPERIPVNPYAPRLQRYMLEAVDSVASALAFRSDLSSAISWFRTHALPAFDNLTPEAMVAARRSRELADWLRQRKAS